MFSTIVVCFRTSPTFLLGWFREAICARASFLAVVVTSSKSRVQVSLLSELVLYTWWYSEWCTMGHVDKDKRKECVIHVRFMRPPLQWGSVHPTSTRKSRHHLEHDPAEMRSKTRVRTETENVSVANHRPNQHKGNSTNTKQGDAVASIHFKIPPSSSKARNCIRDEYRKKSKHHHHHSLKPQYYEGKYYLINN